MVPKLRAKARLRIKACLQNTTVSLYQIEMARRNNKFKSGDKVPLKSETLHSIKRDIAAGDGRAAAEKLHILNESLERFSKRLDSGNKKSVKKR